MSTLLSDVLARYRSRTFIETGTCRGEGIGVALAVGFERIISIEIDVALAMAAQHKFSADRRVSVLCGDSASLLGAIVGVLDEPATFWLDGHEDGVGDDKRTPLLREIEAIGRSLRLVEHHILIDDVRVFGQAMTWGKGLTVDMVLAALRGVIPSANIRREPNTFAPDDIIAVEGRR